MVNSTVKALTPTLNNGIVYVWDYDLDNIWKNRKGLSRLLDKTELDRSSCYRFEIHRRRFVSGRAVLRTVLAQYLNRNPESLKFKYNIHGKPYLSKQQSFPNIKFSASSSHNIGCVAITLDNELGVDLEKVNSDGEFSNLPMTGFCTEEYSWLQSLPQKDKLAAFYDLWTCKEAYLKGLGVGLMSDLNEFCISTKGSKPILVWSKLDVPDSDNWTFQRIKREPGYACCVAVQSNSYKVIARRWDLR